MSVIPTIAPFLLPRMLPRLRRERPNLKLFLREETSQAACDALQRGQLDCVLLATPYPCGNVETMELFEDELLLAFPPHEDPPPRIAAHAIDEQRLLLLEDGHCLKDHALAACDLPQLRVDARMVGTSLNTLVQMVDNGLGLTLLPQMAVSAGILDGTGIVTRPIDPGSSARRIALAWRKGSPRAIEFGLLGEALIAAQGADPPMPSPRP